MHFSIGGEKFVITDETAYQIPYFKSILEKKTSVVLDEQGYIFIDRDPRMFDIILKCVRSNSISFMLKSHEKEEIKQEALFYGVTQIFDPYGYKFTRIARPPHSNYYDSDSN